MDLLLPVALWFSFLPMYNFTAGDYYSYRNEKAKDATTTTTQESEQQQQ
jgi:hypothetical protein